MNVGVNMDSTKKLKASRAKMLASCRRRAFFTNGFMAPPRTNGAISAGSSCTNHLRAKEPVSNTEPVAVLELPSNPIPTPMTIFTPTALEASTRNVLLRSTVQPFITTHGNTARVKMFHAALSVSMLLIQK
jgi:hypothetical protein